MNSIKNNKKGAMFGLDARIALAIFGALSVISGAALYSAIQQSKVIAIITEMNEVGKAYDSYYLDTGNQIDVDIDNVYIDIENLIDSSVKGWEGPYLSYEKHSTKVYSLKHNSYSEIRIAEMLNGAWTDNGSSTTWNTTTQCDAGTVGGICDVWVMFTSVPTDIYNALELRIDGSIDGQNGNLRLVKWASIDNAVFYRYRSK